MQSLAVLPWCLALNCGSVQGIGGEVKAGRKLIVHVFHNSVHRYFVFTLTIALTSMKRLFNLADVDG